MKAQSNLLASLLAALIAISISVQAKPSFGLAQNGNNFPIAKVSTSQNQAAIEICNFEKVTPKIWRGATPKNDQCFSQLKQMGVKSIVNLRMSSLGQKKESSLAKKYGIKYFHVPFGYFKPSNQKVSQVLKLITTQENQPVFVHCMQGADRTGMVIGMYRTLFQNWSYDRTYAEMKVHHFKPWFIGLKAKVKESSSNKPLVTLKNNILFDTQQKRKQALAGISKSELSM